jgi:hypothetical protein
MPADSRRHFLGLLGSAVTVSTGCLGRESGRASSTRTDTSPTTTTRASTDPRTETPTDESSSDETAATQTATATAPVVPTGDRHTSDGEWFTVRRVTAQHTALQVFSDTGRVITPGEDAQFLFADVHGTGKMGYWRWTLVADGDRYGRTDPAHLLVGRGSDESDGNGAFLGWLAFVVPARLDAEDVRIVARDVYDGQSLSWRVSERLRQRLAGPLPRFDVVSVDSPETVSADERVTVRVTAENVGSVRGTFRAMVNIRGPFYTYRPVALELEPGERGTWRESFGSWYDAGEEIRFDVDALSRDVSWTTRVASETESDSSGNEN